MMQCLIAASLSRNCGEYTAASTSSLSDGLLQRDYNVPVLKLRLLNSKNTCIKYGTVIQTDTEELNTTRG